MRALSSTCCTHANLARRANIRVGVILSTEKTTCRSLSTCTCSVCSSSSSPSSFSSSTTTNTIHHTGSIVARSPALDATSSSIANRYSSSVGYSLHNAASRFDRRQSLDIYSSSSFSTSKRFLHSTSSLSSSKPDAKNNTQEKKSPPSNDATFDGGILGALNKKLKETVESDPALKAEYEKQQQQQQKTADSSTTHSNEPKPQVKRAAFASSSPAQQEAPPTTTTSSSSSSTSSTSTTTSPDNEATSPPPPPSSPKSNKPTNTRLYKLVEDVKDVFAVTFGLERKRDIQTEYDLGLREYPWVCYEDPIIVVAVDEDAAEGGEGAPKKKSQQTLQQQQDASKPRIVYRNTVTGLVTELKPSDWDLRAKPSSYLVLNQEANAMALVNEDATRSFWKKNMDSLSESPIIKGAISAGKVVAASPVGAAVGGVVEKVKGVQEAVSEKWETSQHPLVVNSSHVVDAMLTETEQGKALRQIKMLDAGFDEYAFLAEMRDEYIPRMARAYLRYDLPTLNEYGGETALAQAKAAQAARGKNGTGKHDGVVLSVSRVELVQARSVEQGVPMMVLSCLVQYINTVRDEKGVIIDGSESSVLASSLVLAVTRETNPHTGTLMWRTVEIAMQGAQMYL